MKYSSRSNASERRPHTAGVNGGAGSTARSKRLQPSARSSSRSMATARSHASLSSRLPVTPVASSQGVRATIKLQSQAHTRSPGSSGSGRPPTPNVMINPFEKDLFHPQPLPPGYGVFLYPHDATKQPRTGSNQLDSSVAPPTAAATSSITAPKPDTSRPRTAPSVGSGKKARSRGGGSAAARKAQLQQDLILEREKRLATLDRLNAIEKDLSTLRMTLTKSEGFQF